MLLIKWYINKNLIDDIIKFLSLFFKDIKHIIITNEGRLNNIEIYFLFYYIRNSNTIKVIKFHIICAMLL